MRRITYICLLCCSVLAGCEKPQLIVYPDDTHYFGYYHRWLRAFNAIDDFFDRNLIGRPDGMMTSAEQAR